MRNGEYKASLASQKQAARLKSVAKRIVRNGGEKLRARSAQKVA